MARERKGAVISRGNDIYARIRFTDDQGKTRSMERKAKNRTDAKLILKTWIRDLDDGGSKRVLSESSTFADLAREYKTRRLIPAEYHVTSGKVTKIAGLRSLDSPLRWIETLTRHFGRKKLRSITHAAIEDYKLLRIRTPAAKGKNGEPKQRAIASVNRELELLRAMLRFAVRERLILSSPFSDGSPLISKADENKRERVLTYEEETRLLAVCLGTVKKKYKRRGKFDGAEVEAEFKTRRGLLKALIITSLDTAMRRGELLTLKWSDVDLPAGVINILAFNTKTAKGRSVGMTPRVHDEILELYAKSQHESNDLVFGIKDNFKRSWAAAVSDADISDIVFHDLRHTSITRMVQAGLPAAEIMKITGHTQLATFLRYVNPDGSSVRRIADALAAHNEANRKAPVETESAGGFLN